MQILFSINSLSVITFQINFATIIAFLMGILLGMALLALIYLFTSLVKLNKDAIKINKRINDISEDEIKKTIAQYQEAFKDEKKRRKAVPLDFFMSSSKEMINDIAKKFYPDSSRPLSELTINELIMLDRYIIDKIDNLLSKRLFNLFRNVRLTTILKLLDTKTKIENTSLAKTYKRYRLKKVADVFLSVINVINPYHWFKKLVVNPSLNALINKICLVLYSIIGEETYNVYSKQAFLNEDDELELLLKEIDKDQENLNKVGIIVPVSQSKEE